MKWLGIGIIVVALALWASWLWAGRDLKPLDDIERQRAPGQFADLPGAKVHYSLSGPEGAPVIVMVHGFSTPGFIFEQNAAALREAGFQVLQFDHLGRGWSDRPKAKYDVDFYDWELLALLDKLGIDKPAGFVGLSMGGPIVAEFAVRHPERVQRVFLFVPAGLDVSGTGGFQASLLRTPVVGDWIWRMIGLKTVAGDPQYDESGIDPASRLQGDVREQMKYKGYGRALLTTFRNFHMSGRNDTWRALAATGIPVSAVFGDADPTIPVSSAARLTSLVPEAEIMILEAGDHGLNYKRHADVNDTLTDWFLADRVWFPIIEAVMEGDDEFEGASVPSASGDATMSPRPQRTIRRAPTGIDCERSRIRTRRCQ